MCPLTPRLKKRGGKMCMRPIYKNYRTANGKIKIDWKSSGIKTIDKLVIKNHPQHKLQYFLQILGFLLYNKYQSHHKSI